MHSIFENLLNLFYPRLCQCCGHTLVKNEEHICTQCDYDLPRNTFHNDPANPVAQLFWGRVMIEKATAYLQYQKGSGVQEIIHKIKYDAEKEMGTAMGRKFGLELSSVGFSDIDCIIPVPLHPMKQRRRGFNQSEVIAAGIAEALQKPVLPDALKRVTDTDTQTRRSRYDRWQNVENIFSVAEMHLLENKHVLLVDDVVTTGATVESCAAAILKVPGTKVSLAALAFAVN